jgi:predicted transcriptional regulator
MSGNATLQNLMVKSLSRSKKPVRLEQLVSETGYSSNAITQAITKLIFRDLVDRVESGVYTLTRKGRKLADSGQKISSGPVGKLTGPRAPNLRNSLTQRAWNVMRMGGTFTVPDLVMAAANTSDREPENSLQRYLRHLCACGYIIMLPTRTKGTRPGSNGFKRYQLANDTGEIAPTVRYRKNPVEVFDQNNREVVTCQ